jgi:hypothetical protein
MDARSEMPGYRATEWLDPRLTLRPSPIGGRGLFAQAPIAAGEVVIIWGGTLFTDADIADGRVAPGSTVAIGEGLYLGSAPGTYVRERDDLGDFINHSCDPNVWLQDEVTSVARREISVGDELTMDYTLFLAREDHIADWRCRCGSSLCRGVVKGRDWRIPALQARYAGHFSPFLSARIGRLSAEHRTRASGA